MLGEFDCVRMIGSDKVVSMSSSADLPHDDQVAPKVAGRDQWPVAVT